MAEPEPIRDETVVLPRPQKGLTPRESVGALIVVALWLGLFLGGMVIDSSPFRNVLNDPNRDFGIETVRSAIVAGLVYTPSNIAALCLVAGTLGAFGRRAQLFDNADGNGPAPPADNINPFLSGLLRGFVVYLVLLSGLLLVIENPFGNPTQQQYVRLAGLGSLVSFLVSYDPRIFGSLMARIVQAIEGRLGNGNGA